MTAMSGIAWTSIYSPEREKLEELLNKHFPKGKCRERGRALVMFAEYVCWLENTFVHLRVRESWIKRFKRWLIK